MAQGIDVAILRYELVSACLRFAALDMEQVFGSPELDALKDEVDDKSKKLTIALIERN